MGAELNIIKDDKAIVKEKRMMVNELNKLFNKHLFIKREKSDDASELSPMERAEELISIIGAAGELKNKIERISKEEMHSAYSKLLYLEHKITTELRALQRKEG